MGAKQATASKRFDVLDKPPPATSLSYLVVGATLYKQQPSCSAASQ